MATTVIGTFDDKAVQKVMAELRDAGFESGTVEVLEGSQDELIAEITGRGFDKADARSYAEAVSRGKKLVAASGSDQEADRAATIMERYEASEEEGEEQGGRGTQDRKSVV